MHWPTSIGMDLTSPASVDGQRYFDPRVMCATTMSSLGEEHQMIAQMYRNAITNDIPSIRPFNLTYDKKPVAIAPKEEKPLPWWKRIFGAKVVKI